ncbi:MAG: LpxL/LpxP family acyltransferase, partial [bacterium]
RAFFEIGIAWWWPRSRFDKICRVEGLEILQELEGQGALLTAIHFTTLEIGAAAISNAMSIDGMHRPHKNALYDYIQGYGRRRRGADTTTYPRKDVRGMLKALKSGRVIWYAPDQDYGIKQGIFAPFMGVMAATITATARFASAGNARIIPLTQQRLPYNQGYLVKVHPPLEGFPVGDDYQDAVIVNQLVERMIREQPASYMWVHRRFKNRPPGESSVYK